MSPFPQPIEHEQRMQLAHKIAERLLAKYGASVKAIGLYGSLARNEDGPFSDIEMFCVLRETTEAHNYEWCAGPWKAEVNVRDEISLRQEAAQIDGSGPWALTHGAFVHILPLIDPEHYFAELKQLAISYPPEVFRAEIEGVLIGDIYELIGKIRNAHFRKHYHALPMLAVELAKRTAYALGLEHRHLYGTSSNVLTEALTLPDPPDGFHALAHLVMHGNLQDAATVASTCDTLWTGLVHWAEQRGYTLVSAQEIPF